MYTLKAQNKSGDIIELTNNSSYSISSVEGLSPSDAVISTTHNAGADGTIFNSSYVGEKTITITMAINSPAESNRINLYKYFKTKYPIRLLYSNGMRDVYIDGYVESIQVNYFEIKEIAQIVIKCPFPYFQVVGVAEQVFGVINASFEFPFSIESPIPFSEINLEDGCSIINSGDIPTGAIITVRALGSVSFGTITNEDGQYFKLNAMLSAEDVVTINTIKGQKSCTLLRDGVETSILTSIDSTSTWLELNPGDNTLYISAGDETLIETTVKVPTLYEGV